MKRTPRRVALNDVERGDFQTPRDVARQICGLLSMQGIKPAAVVEPTCGVGNFLLEALDAFPTATKAVGVELNPAYVDRLVTSLGTSTHRHRVALHSESFFSVDWPALLDTLPNPVLVIGNPPWVTNSQLSALDSHNLPTKTNFQKHEGLDAVTGKSNFDISEWMLIRLLELLSGRPAMLAMLCKTAVARKVLAHAWKTGLGLAGAEIRSIDANVMFDAAVDACLLICSLVPGSANRNCYVYASIDATEATGLIGFRQGRMIADMTLYARWKHLEGASPYDWRSGIKHDCSDVMEVRQEGALYRNGLGEMIDLEAECLYPMLKSSDLARPTPEMPRRWMIVTQKQVGDQTESIQRRAPKTWSYLQEHGHLLDRRGSTVYRNRPRFSVFGVGEYSFSPWKVAISGFYKRLQFVVVGNIAGKPIVLDDTAYFIACRTEDEARAIATVLNSAPSREFFSAFVFWDAKRPITAELLRRLNVLAAAQDVGGGDVIARLRMCTQPVLSSDQGDLFGSSERT